MLLHEVKPTQCACADSREERIGTDSLIADMAVRSTDLTIAEHIVYTKALEVTFFCEAVTCRERGKNAHWSAAGKRLEPS